MRTTSERTPAELRALTTEECLERLAACRVGRFAVALPGQAPLVVPVNYVLDGDVVVFRSGAGEKVERLRQHPASFQVDQIDPGRQTGWSVLITGVAHEAAPAEVAHLDVEPWAPGERRRWIRVVPHTMTGRLIVPSELVLGNDGYL
jgi:nitroimidazol reductase NimA-like FMN-containing flavoprotein (pyridoxamine 5'-phosphate oxidase superfamily)